MVGFFSQFYKMAISIINCRRVSQLNYLYLNYAWEMTLKQTLFELGLLISPAFLFQVHNATDSLKATRAIYSFLGLNENFTE